MLIPSHDCLSDGSRARFYAVGVFHFKPDGAGMVLSEIAPDVSLDALRAATLAEFEVAADLKVMAC